MFIFVFSVVINQDKDVSKYRNVLILALFCFSKFSMMRVGIRKKLQ